MSTARNEGNKSGDNNADDQPTGTKLYIQMLERGGDELTSDMNKGLNLFLCFIALCILYGLYFLFGWGWLAAMWTFGDDLNWVFLGLMLSVGGGMGMGVAYSMKSQQSDGGNHEAQPTPDVTETTEVNAADSKFIKSKAK
eukprot:CAMPEP_0197058010 /NCGR_PEP_ID=MMETSP1384-20130603/103068_1 /TAXON_ID=29189 /ORGANISM="Ammonia sp." /LENGTH=139 /DNA_ID=CAMNT_0042492613 /DNA_START=85 /DNA_END=502 /DNA_ORIENTATION=+